MKANNTLGRINTNLLATSQLNILIGIIHNTKSIQLRRNSMTTKNALYKTCFNHNDVLLDHWYDQTLEQSDENEVIGFDNAKGCHIFGEAYLNWLNDELFLNLQFDGIYFPREYNFESDAINLSFSKDDFDQLKAIFESEDLAQALHGHIKRITTSRSGYIAFYNYDQVINDVEMLMRSMLQVYSNMNNDEFDYYYDRQYVYEALLDCIIYNEAN